MTALQFFRTLQAAVQSLRSEQWRIALVVHTKGSVPRKAGALMAIDDSGQTIGSIGGGAAEAKVINESANPACQQVQIVLRERDGICGGDMQIAIKRFDSPALLAVLSDYIASLQSGQALGLHWLAELAPVWLAAKPTVLIAGVGHCGMALWRQLQILGYPCLLIDDRGATLEVPLDVIHPEFSAELLPYTQPKPMAVLLNRSYQQDVEVLQQIAHSAVAFHWIGMMGSARRAQTVLRQLAPDIASKLTITSPVGLYIGAETPEEIAISIAAQIILAERAEQTRL